MPGEGLVPGRVERAGQVGPLGEPDALDASGPDRHLGETEPAAISIFTKYRIGR